MQLYKSQNNNSGPITNNIITKLDFTNTDSLLVYVKNIDIVTHYIYKVTINTTQKVEIALVTDNIVDNSEAIELLETSKTIILDLALTKNNYFAILLKRKEDIKDFITDRSVLSIEGIVWIYN